LRTRCTELFTNRGISIARPGSRPRTHHKAIRTVAPHSVARTRCKLIENRKIRPRRHRKPAKTDRYLAARLSQSINLFKAINRTYTRGKLLPLSSSTACTSGFTFLQRAQCSHCKRCISYSNSVCPSVCLSVTCRYCVKTTARSTVQFVPLDSKMCLVL